MTAQIIFFPQKPSRTAAQAFLLASKALLTDCMCDDCVTYRRLLGTDEKAAERFLMGL
jgi:hypothetical protein